jgi:nucleoside phosphorylase
MSKVARPLRYHNHAVQSRLFTMSDQADVTVGYICADTAALASCCISLEQPHQDLENHPPWDNNSYTFGMIGPRHVVVCPSVEQVVGSTAVAAADLMRTFSSVKLLILVSSKAGVVPGDQGQVRLGDVVVPPKLVSRREGYELTKTDLPKASGILATTSTGMSSAQSWCLDEEIATLIRNNDRWGQKCERPAGDDVDELAKTFVRQCQDASLAHHDGVVISERRSPECADYWDSVAGPLNLGPIVCFDDGQTADLPLHRKEVDMVSVLGVSHYCDENADAARSRWQKYASMAAAACAKRIVLELDNESDKE